MKASPRRPLGAPSASMPNTFDSICPLLAQGHLPRTRCFSDSVDVPSNDLVRCHMPRMLPQRLHGSRWWLWDLGPPCCVTKWIGREVATLELRLRGKDEAWLVTEGQQDWETDSSTELLSSSPGPATRSTKIKLHAIGAKASRTGPSVPIYFS